MSADVGIVDVGAGPDPDQRADLTIDVAESADVQADLDEEWPLEDGVARGIVASHVVEHLEDPWHFFAEARRVLKPGGWLEITVPVGLDAVTDPSHEQHWTAATPRRFCDARSEPWDPDTGFVLEDTDVDVWMFGPFKPLTPLLNRAAQRWPGWAVRRCGAGEVTARYREVGR
ncbi:MAG: methyltransferase domain-containing protein [Halorhabdus sp.]